MKKSFLIMLSLTMSMMTMFGCNSYTIQSDKDYNEIHFYIGDPLQYNVSVNIDFKEQIIHEEVCEFNIKTVYEQRFNENEIQKIKHDLSFCNFQNWEDDYINEKWADGTQWRLDIKYDNSKTVHIEGSNDFPTLNEWNTFIEKLDAYCKSSISIFRMTEEKMQQYNIIN